MSILLLYYSNPAWIQWFVLNMKQHELNWSEIIITMIYRIWKIIY